MNERSEDQMLSIIHKELYWIIIVDERCEDQKLSINRKGLYLIITVEERSEIHVFVFTQLFLHPCLLLIRIKKATTNLDDS